MWVLLFWQICVWSGNTLHFSVSPFLLSFIHIEKCVTAAAAAAAADSVHVILLLCWMQTL